MSVHGPPDAPMDYNGPLRALQGRLLSLQRTDPFLKY